MKQEVEWIRVEKRMPIADGRYLVHVPTADPKSPYIGIAWWHPKEQAWSLIIPQFAQAITHWMKVPKPPKEK